MLPPGLIEIVGGWQISTIARFRTGLPSSIFYSGVYPDQLLVWSSGVSHFFLYLRHANLRQKGKPERLRIHHLSQELAAYVCRLGGNARRDPSCRYPNFDMLGRQILPDCRWKVSGFNFAGKLSTLSIMRILQSDSGRYRSPPSFGEYTQDMSPGA